MGYQKFRQLFSTILTCALLFAPVAHAETSLTLSEFRNLEERDKEVSGLVLKAMREVVFYAQESRDEAVICATPIPVAGARLMEILEAEIANPTNPSGRAYVDGDPVAFVFFHALRREGICK